MVRMPHFRAEHPLDEIRVLGFVALVATLVSDLRPYVQRLGLRYCAVVIVGVLIERWLSTQPGGPDERPPVTLNF